VAALEARDFQSHQVRMPRRKLRCPHLVVGAAGVRVLPGIADVQRVTDYPGAHFVAEETLQHVFIQRQRVLGKDGIAQLLELFHDLVIQSRIVVVRPAQHDDADAILTFELVKNLTGPATDVAFVVFQRLVPCLNRAIVFLLRQSEDGPAGERCPQNAEDRGLRNARTSRSLRAFYRTASELHKLARRFEVLHRRNCNAGLP